MTSCGRSSELQEDNGRRTKFVLAHALPALTDFPAIHVAHPKPRASASGQGIRHDELPLLAACCPTTRASPAVRATLPGSSVQRPKLTPLRRPRTAGLGYSIWRAVTSLLGGKLQLPLNRLEARLLAQGIHEGIGLQGRQAAVTQVQGRLEPL